MGTEFGEKLESTLKEQGMTQKELAEKASVKKNKSSLSESQRFELIRLLSN